MTVTVTTHAGEHKIRMVKMAVRLYPRTDYTDPSAVRHARLNWLRSVDILRTETRKGWLIDNKVQRCAA